MAYRHCFAFRTILGYRPTEVLQDRWFEKMMEEKEEDDESVNEFFEKGGLGFRSAEETSFGASCTE